jgi:hypothetical protein
MGAITGMKWGLLFAGCYSAVLLIIVAFGGGQSLKRLNLTVAGAIALYLIAGVLGGLAFGALWTPQSSRARRLAVGWLVAFIALTVLSSGADGSIFAWRASRWVITAFAAAIIGCGAVFTLPAAAGSASRSTADD